MLLNGLLWAPALARVMDTSLRYTVDKTTREILFLPLPDVGEAAGEAVHRRHGGSLLEGHRRADRAGADQQDLGLPLHLAATELGQLVRHRSLGLRGDARAPRVPRRVPEVAGPPAGAARVAAAQRGRPDDDRDARRGAEPPEPAARDLRDRHARVAGQAAADHAASAEPRLAGRAGPRARASSSGRRRRSRSAGCPASSA